MIIALLLLWAGATGGLTGSDDLQYLHVAGRIASGSYTPCLHPFYARFGLTVPLAACLRAGISSSLAWRLPGALAYLGIGLLVHRALRPQGRAVALLATLALLADRTVLTQAWALFPDLPGALPALAAIGLWCRFGRDRRCAALAGGLFGLAWLTKETVCLGIAGILGAGLLKLLPRSLRWGAFLAGLAAVLCVEAALGQYLASDPLYHLHTIESGHNPSVWARAPGLKDLLGGPVTALVPLGLLAVPACGWRRRSRGALLAAWAAGLLVGLLGGTSSLTHYQRLPALDRMMVPVLVSLPLLAATVRISRPLVVAVCLWQLAHLPPRPENPLAGELQILNDLAQFPQWPIRTDHRSAEILAALSPSLAARVTGKRCGSPSLVLWNFPRLAFLAGAYGEALEPEFARPPNRYCCLVSQSADRWAGFLTGIGYEIWLDPGLTNSTSQ